MTNKLIQGTFILTIATFVIRILGSIFRIPLQNIAGDEVMGIFSLVYPVYLVALNLSVAGIPVAISRLISEANARQKKGEIHQIYQTAVLLTIGFGLISFSFIFCFSEQIAVFLGGESVLLALIIVSATLLIAPYMAVYRGYFQGFENMNPTAVSQMLEQFVRVVFILLIAYIFVKKGYSPEIISGAIMVSSFIGALVSLFYLRYLFSTSSIKPKKERIYQFADFLQTGKFILKISIPICIGAIAMSLINFVDSFTIPISLIHIGFLEKEIPYLYGIYGRGLALVQIAAFSTSIVLPLIPMISKAIVQKNWAEVSDLVEKAHDYTHILSWPIALGMFALTLPINLALFKDLQGSSILAAFHLSAITMSLCILGTGILQGMNKEKLAARIIMASVLLKIITNFMFIKWLGLIGAAISTIFVYLVICLVNTYFIRKEVQFKVWKKSNTSMVISSVVMACVVGLPTLFIDFTNWTRITTFLYLILSIIMAMAIYGILLVLTKGISRDELMTMPVINKLVRKRT